MPEQSCPMTFYNIFYRVHLSFIYSCDSLLRFICFSSFYPSSHLITHRNICFIANTQLTFRPSMDNVKNVKDV